MQTFSFVLILTWRMVRRTNFIMLAVAGAALALRVSDLDARSLWHDEAFSWRLSQFSTTQIVERVKLDTHPPLYFLLLKFWRGLCGDSVFAMRSLSALCGCAAVFGVYSFLREAFADPRRDSDETVPTSGLHTSSDRILFAAVLAAGLVALSVFQIRWAREVRMYALGTALAAWSSCFMFRALHRSLGSWALYGVVTLCFAYTHYYALFSIAAQAVFLIGCVVVSITRHEHAKRRRLLRWYAARRRRRGGRLSPLAAGLSRTGVAG